MAAILTSIRSPFAAYILPSPSIVGRRLRFAPLTTNDRFGFRGDRVTYLSAHAPSSTSPAGQFRQGQRNSRLSIRGTQGNHTIFDGYVPAFRRHHSFVVVLARFTPLSTRNLRLLFRLVRTGICAPPSNRHTAAIRHHPPTRKRTDERTVFQPVALAVILHPRAERIIRRLPMARALSLTPPGMWRLPS